jgi:hypothetical protein
VHLIPNSACRFRAHPDLVLDLETINQVWRSEMAIVIQSRSCDGDEWRNEVWRRTHFEAYTAARTKARLTGRVYRLVDQEGQVLEEVRFVGSRWGNGREPGGA